MSFAKRAFLYCFRQRVKTLILFLVLATISTFLLTGLAIRDASEGATADVQTAIGGRLLLEMHWSFCLITSKVIKTVAEGEKWTK